MLETTPLFFAGVDFRIQLIDREIGSTGVNGLIIVVYQSNMIKRLYIAFILCFLLGEGFADAQTPKRYTCKVEETFLHDAGAYTQGLFFHEGQLYESTGQYGESTLRKVDLRSGKVTQRHQFDRRYFAEGSCILGGRLYVLSWMERTCFVFNPKTLERIGSCRYNGEGWGLTTDGKSLIMSDGSSKLFFRDPNTFQITSEINVKINGRPLEYLNELEYIDDKIWANVYGTDAIVIINPADGVVTATVDCSGLLPSTLRKPSTDVFNGIAYNPENGGIYVTGKYWPRLYRISLK